MKVELIARPSYVGSATEQASRARADQMVGTDGEVIAEFAGRGCYDSYGKGRDSDAFATNIREHGHVNVLYHSHFVFAISDVSRNLTHELVRHHVGFAPSMRSTRYVDERESRVVHHPDLGSVDDLPSYLRSKMSRFDSAWRDLYAEVVEHMMANGHDRKTAQGAAARYLPSGIETFLTWSGNAAAFLSMIERRKTPKVVDTEFRLLAKEMLRHLQAEMPRYFGHVEVEG